LKNQLRNFLLASPLKHYLVFRYEFNFTPAQLGFLCECLTKTEPVPGNILEIGCAQGNTTVFLNRHLDTLKSTKSYTCVDTFTGFTERDIAWEVNQRNKESNMFSGFQLGKKMFDVTLAFNNVKRVTAIQDDILNVNADTFGKVSFTLLDVDLYYPISIFLPNCTSAIKQSPSPVRNEAISSKGATVALNPILTGQILLISCSLSTLKDR
jgi:hypothetical protein